MHGWRPETELPNPHPRLDKPNEGRFVIKSAEFLDPMIYAKGREITVVGTLDGGIERTIGKKSFGCHC